MNHLKQIGIALRNYHDEYRCFPPAYIADEHGTPLHSWRILLLGCIEDERIQKLYEQYRFDEPWNGPHNRRLMSEAPSIYRCPDDKSSSSQTSYIAVVGPQAFWPGAQPIKIRQITDGTSRTIEIIECANSGINWLDPRDALFENAAWGINNRSTRPAFRSNHVGGAMALFADGSVHFLPDDIKRDILRGLLTPAGGENVEIPE